jgi:mono/diheme cytochrome c family protein
MNHEGHETHHHREAFKGVVVFVTLVIVVAGLGGTRSAARQGVPAIASQAPSQPRALVDRYCVTCHNDRLRTAGLSLVQADTERPFASAEIWEKVIRKLQTGAMPPTGMPRPDQPALDALVSYLESSIDSAAAAQPNPGRPALRRLNRTEYTNAIRDLLGVEIDAGASLPADDSRYGFDNVGDVLTLSPLLAERYLAVARQVRRLALGDPSIRPTIEQYEVSKNLMQDDRAGEDLPFGSRGGLAVRHQFPADGEYVFRVRLQQNSRQYIRGMQQPNELDVRIDGRSVQHFSVGGERKGKSSFVFSSATMGDIPQEQYERTADELLNVRQRVAAGAHQVSASFLDDGAVPERPLQQRLTMYDYSQYKGGNAGIATLTIEGPYNVTGSSETESRRRIFICRPRRASDEEPCAERILGALARRAYRRPVTDDDLRPLLAFFAQGRRPPTSPGRPAPSDGRAGGFDAGIGLALERLLAGPEFLFRIERDGADAASVYRVSDYDLASRLSFFLWSSIPDDTLLDLAERGRLKDPVVVEQQVRRMLRDPRACARHELCRAVAASAQRGNRDAGPGAVPVLRRQPA